MGCDNGSIDNCLLSDAGVIFIIFTTTYKSINRGREWSRSETRGVK